KVFPPGAKATTRPRTLPLNRPSSRPVAVSQTLTFHVAADATSRPSGEKATESTPPLCRQRTVPIRPTAPAGSGSPYRSAAAAGPVRVRAPRGQGARAGAPATGRGAGTQDVGTRQSLPGVRREGAGPYTSGG